jgi:hypothetical protein
MGSRKVSIEVLSSRLELPLSHERLQFLYMSLFQEHTIISTWSDHSVFGENKTEPAQVFYI